MSNTTASVTSQSQIIFNPALANFLQPMEAGQLGNANVLELLLPTLYGQSDKKQQPLQKVDYYMLEETQELLSRLRRFCYHLNISEDTQFKVARCGEQLQIIGHFEHRRALNKLVNEDLWFVDSFLWLQPNYSSLAHSFEMLEFSECYEQNPVDAREKFSHFEREDKGLAFALKYANGAANAQVESPLNLYRV